MVASLLWCAGNRVDILCYCGGVVAADLRLHSSYVKRGDGKEGSLVRYGDRGESCVPLFENDTWRRVVRALTIRGSECR
jgi:hypothetical protein